MVFNECQLVYATQSGRAKACARRTARTLADDVGLQLVRPPMTFDAAIGPDVSAFAEESKSRPSRLLVLFVSTTGDGEQTDSIQSTWQQL